MDFSVIFIMTAITSWPLAAVVCTAMLCRAMRANCKDCN
jgi:hypothetical protein